MEANSSLSTFTFELEPIDPRRLRDAKGTVLWETVQGKRNRISIGYPRCYPETKPTKTGLLTDADLKQFPLNQFAFYYLDLTFTLLPDRGCRFRSADLILELKSTTSRLGPPLVLRLQPAVQAMQKSIVIEEGAKSGVTASDSILKVLSVEAATTASRKEELSKTMVSMESFGNGTRQAGWRFQITDSQEIPLTSSNLKALIVQSKDKPTKAEFNLTAEVDIHAKLDEWLTWAFKRKDEPGAQLEYSIPPKSV